MAKEKALVVKKQKKTAVIKRKYTDAIVAALLENEEDKLLALENSGQVVNALMYQAYDKKTKELLHEDLTYIGYRELCRNIKDSYIKFGEPKFVTNETEEKGQITKTVQVLVEAKRFEVIGGIVTEVENAWGTKAAGSRFSSGKFVVSPEAAALSKAQRNAMKQLIPIQKKMAMMSLLKSARKKFKGQIVRIEVDAKDVQKILPEADEHARALKAVFAIINDLGLDKEAAHGFLRAEYKTEHLSSLEVKQLKDVVARLNKVKAKESYLADLKEKIKEFAKEKTNV